MFRKHAYAVLAVACLAIVGSSALGASSASAAGTERCTENSPGVGTGTFYENGECLIENNLTGKWHRLTVGGNWFTRIFDRGFEKYSVSAGGTEYAWECSNLTNSGGSAENVTEAGVNKVKGKEMALEYSKCSVTSPSGCKIEKGAFKTVKLKSLATTKEGLSSVKFEPESGTTVMTVPITECALATNLVIKGTFTGVVPKANESKVEFTTTSGSALTVVGNGVTYTGWTRAEVEGTSEVIFIGP